MEIRDGLYRRAGVSPGFPVVASTAAFYLQLSEIKCLTTASSSPLSFRYPIIMNGDFC